jgi:hypothetical protein
MNSPVHKISRIDTRQTVSPLAYVEILNEDNGGILVNVSEGGLALQVAKPLVENRFLRVKFQLPKSKVWIKAVGQIAWVGDSKKQAGVCFVDLPYDTRLEIRQWLKAANSPERVISENARRPSPLNGAIPGAGPVSVRAAQPQKPVQAAHPESRQAKPEHSAMMRLLARITGKTV